MLEVNIRCQCINLFICCYPVSSTMTTHRPWQHSHASHWIIAFPSSGYSRRHKRSPFSASKILPPSSNRFWHLLSQAAILRSNKNVDIKFSAHDAFLEYPLSGTFKIDRLERQIILSFGSNNTKGFNLYCLFRGVRVTRSLVLCAMFGRLLFVLLYFFFWPLCCLFFFDIRILVASCVSSNSFYIP